MTFVGFALDSFQRRDASAWGEVFGGVPEGYDYFAACERAVPPSFEFAALAVEKDGALVAGAPLFKTAISLDLALDGVARTLVRGIGKVLPFVRSVPLFGIGTPYAHDANIAFKASVDEDERLSIFNHMIDALEDEARRQKSDLILLKDVSAEIRRLSDDDLRKRGYARITALPIAVLQTPATEAAYFDSISGNMRSNLRRRLKRAKDLRVEMRTSCEGLESELHELRLATMQRAETDYDVFEEIAPNYYSEVLAAMGDNARLLTYWLDDKLLGFSMVLLGRDKLIQTYNGMRYPEGPDNGVFYLDWMTQLRLCMERGIPIMQSGVTTYLIKARLGCTFQRSYIYVRHRNAVMNTIIRWVSPYIDLEKGDPGLKELGATAPFA